MDEEKKKKGSGRYLFMVVFVLAIVAVFIFRLADWQLVHGFQWLKAADQSSTYAVKMDAARGEILDSKGVGLAVNETGYAIQFNGATMRDSSKNKTILALIRLLDSQNEKWTDEFPIQVNSSGKYEFISGRDADIKYLKSKSFLNVNPYATADECMKHLVDKYKCTGYSVKDTRNILSVRYNMAKTGFTVSTPYIFAPDVSQNTVAIISENSSNLPGVEAKVTAERKYPFGTLMPQIVGSIGAMSSDQYKALKDKGYEMNSRIGEGGIEQYAESWLRGKEGEETVKFGTDGSLTSETVAQKPTSGDTVWLTIDSNLQKVLNKSLADNVKATNENGQKNHTATDPKGSDCVGGAAVVLRVKDFAVLAAATYPTYDQNRYASDSDYRVQLLNDQKTYPLINRAFNGQFTPGSCFKPSVALAALQEGAITDKTTFTCNGIFVLGDLRLRCWLKSGHGTLTVRNALAESCNVFFCNTAVHTGISAMNLYAKRLGLGQKTGVEIGESAGTLAGLAERKNSGGTWTEGDTAQAGIGQSDNMLTPIQLATMAATVANNGVRLKTHVIDKVTDYTRKNTIYTTPTMQMDSIGVSAQNLKIVQEGMRAVCTKGTAASYFSNYGIAIAGKTGTGQTGENRSDNVSFIGYAPYDNPQIAIAVVLEHGATSKYSNQIAKDIFDAYFFGKTVDANGNFVTSPAVSAASH